MSHMAGDGTPILPEAPLLEPQRYTLEEAKHQLRLEHCKNYGHEYDMVVTAGGGLIGINCPGCGKRWKVEEA